MVDEENSGADEDLTLPSQKSVNNGGSVPSSSASDAVAQLNADTLRGWTAHWTLRVRPIAKWSSMLSAWPVVLQWWCSCVQYC